MSDKRKGDAHPDLVEAARRVVDLTYVALSKNMAALAATAMQQDLTETEFIRLAKNAFIQAETSLHEIQRSRDPRPKS